MKQVLMHVLGDVEASRDEIEAHKGRIVHRLSPAVIVAEVPADFDFAVLTRSKPVSDATRVAAASGNHLAMQESMRKLLPSKFVEGADESTRSAIAAWHYQLTEGKKVSPNEGVRWDHPGHKAP